MNAAYSGPIYEAASDDSSSLNRKSMSLNAQAWKEKWRLQQGSRLGALSQNSDIMIPAAEMRRDSRRELRRRLRNELSIVQGLYSKIETRELQLRRQHSHSTGVYPALSDAQFSGNDARSIAGKEVTSSPRHLADYRARPIANGIERKGKSGKKKPDLLTQCKAILKKLMAHKDGWIFNEPVDAEKLGLSDYHYFIKKPMDLGTIKARLEKRGYGSLEHFASDVRLTFDNAMTYNPPGNDVHQMAKGLRNMFEKSWIVISRKMAENERPRQVQTFPEPFRDSQEALQGEFDRNNPQKKRPSVDSAAVAKKKKPKTVSQLKGSAEPKALSRPKTAAHMSGEKKPKREMSYEEKKNLVESLQLLPALMQDEIIQLMKKRNPDLSQKDDEIEVDIDCFDNETLWELDECVKSGLKTMDATENVGDPLEQPLAGVAGAEDKLNTPDNPVQDEDIDIMGDAHKGASPVIAHNDGASGGNRPSSSGSSSSDTGSSSDSDSESSSSDSEGGV